MPEAPRTLREAISEPLESKSKEELIKLVQAAREDEEWFRQRYNAAQGTVRALEGYRAQWNAAHAQDAPRTLRDEEAKCMEFARKFLAKDSTEEQIFMLAQLLKSVRAQALAASTPEGNAIFVDGKLVHRSDKASEQVTLEVPRTLRELRNVIVELDEWNREIDYRDRHSDVSLVRRKNVLQHIDNAIAALAAATPASTPLSITKERLQQIQDRLDEGRYAACEIAEHDIISLLTAAQRDRQGQ